MTLNHDKQLLTPGHRVELFDFDLTSLGGEFYRFVSSFQESGDLHWQGNVYTLLPIEASGFEVAGSGALPTPKLRISNAMLLMSTLINALGDPLGGAVTRWVTFSDYLDDGPTPDPNEHFIPQKFVVERKTAQNNVFVEFELSAAMDQAGRKLPGRQVLRDTCLHRYRYYDQDAGAFNYDKATCPWAGSDGVIGGDEGPYFSRIGESTSDPISDRCGKRLSDCRKRFGRDPLPFRGFPAVGRVR